MFRNIDINNLKHKHKEEIKKNNSKKRKLKDLKEFLNPFDYKEFMPFYLPKSFEQGRFIIKPLPFVSIDRENVEAISIPFSKHLSKDIKLNCRKNIDDWCPICEAGTIKKFDFIIFPVYIISNSVNNYYKNEIKLIEIPLNDWEKFIFPYIEEFYKEDKILIINYYKKNFIFKYSIEKYKVEELNEDIVLNKSFIYKDILNYLYSEKAYVKEFNIEINPKTIIVSSPF